MGRLGRDRWAPFLRCVLPTPVPFLDGLFASLQRDGLEVAPFELDHLCYRVASEGRYAEVKQWLASQGTLLGEHLIGGRAIATFRLRQAYVFQGRSIHMVELPAPKAGSAYAEGWEHAEFVVPEELLAFVQRHPTLPWDLEGLHKAHNPEVRLRYGSASVKFHRTALEELIAAEARNPAAPRA